MILDVLRELVGVLAALGLVSLLAWAAIALMKRFQIQGPGGASADDLRFLRALPLGPRERLVVVEWRGETLLLGVTAGGISLLERRPAGTSDADPGGAASAVGEHGGGGRGRPPSPRVSLAERPSR